MTRPAAALILAVLILPSVASAGGDPNRGAEIYRACVVCHALAPGLHLTGPSLGDVWLRPAGTAERFARYSPALRNAGFPWDANALDAWLTDPQAMLRGNTMSFRGISDAEARADVVAFLERAGTAGGAEDLVKAGAIPEAYLRAQAPEPLIDAPPEMRVAAVRHCGDGYTIVTADGGESQLWEQNVRLKIDSADTGPPAGVGVIVGAGMQGDRFSLIFASVADLVNLVSEECR